MTDVITARQMRELHALLRDHGISGDHAVHDYLTTALREHGEEAPESRSALTAAQATALITDLRSDPTRAPSGLAVALIKVQKALPMVKKSKTAKIAGRNGAAGYSYTYADLGDVTEAAMPLLTKHGLAFTCSPRATERGYELAGILLHESGETREGALPLHGNDPQQLGGALTYHRRYLLGCLIGLVTDDDVDGRQAMGASRTREWDGPSTAQLLAQIDSDAHRAGVTYEAATANLRRDLHGISVDDLDSLDPWVIAPFAKLVHQHADKVVADRAKAEAVTEDQPAAAEEGDPWANPARDVPASHGGQDGDGQRL